MMVSVNLNAQLVDSTRILVDFEKPVQYKIEQITISGNTYTPAGVILVTSGLKVGQTITIPGDDTKQAISKLWKRKLFSDIEIGLNKVKDGKISLHISVVERPALSKYSIKGLKKAETNNVRDEISLQTNQLITEDLINKTKSEILAYFYEKGFYGVKTSITRTQDPKKPNFQILRIEIDRGKKVRMQDLVFVGNENISSKKLRKIIKPKRRYKKFNFFATSKFVQDEYEETKPGIIQAYSALGYRDAYIVYDSIQQISDDRVIVKIGINEGNKYFFRNISWVGNTKYRTSLLDTLLGIKAGDVYDQSKLESKLFMSENGFDISSLYMDDGYLFFNVNPVEVLVENDSIDLEMRVYEGKQATVNRVSVVGNDKTSDFVALRVIRTRPGDKFSRSDIQRSMRELAQLGFF